MGSRITVLAVAVAIGAPAAADVVVVEDPERIKDNTLIEKSDGSLSNGIGEYFFAGRTNQGSDEDQRRGVLAFDLAGLIPAGSQIETVTLTLRMSRSQVGGRDVSLHRLLADWGEGASEAGGGGGEGTSAEPGDATWLHTFYDTDLWSSAGGDFVGTSSATLSVSGNGFYDWSAAGMVADVQGWVDQPSTNFGWILVGDETQQSAKRFDSIQNGNASRRPKLTVEFTPPASTGACCLPGGGCVVVTPADCTTQMGDYRGDGVTCVDADCPQPTGACCLSGAVCMLLTAGECSGADGSYQGDGTTCDPNPCPLELEPFVDPLPIPGPLAPVEGEPGGEATYDVAMTEFDHQCHRDLGPTRVWGYAGSYPGPIIEARPDLPVTVRWINDLRDAQGQLRQEHYLPVDPCPHGVTDASPRTVVHLHGGHVPADVDGYPEDTFLPGEQVEYVYPNNQLPANIWFHDHGLGITRLNVYMGLAGLYMLRDDFEEGLNLPAGEFEVPLVVQDRSFNLDGTLLYPAAWQDHFFGDFVLVNGKVWPYLEVKQGKYRFRVLSGSNSRTYTLFLSDGATFWQIGTDGGLLPAPVPLTELTVASGERADLVLDFSGYAPGTEIILTNSAPAPFPGQPGVGVIPNVMKFVVTDEAGFTDPLPETLRDIEILREEDAVQTRDLVLRKRPEKCAGSVWLINDLGWDDITERPQLGSTEIWRFANTSGNMHPMHMHLVFFQVLDRQAFELVDGEIMLLGDPVPPPPNEAGWKDTARVNPREITRVIARFEDYLGLYAYHCHILEHEDHEMMRQFQVVPACPADLDGSGAVDFADILAILSTWGNAGGPEDLDGSGVVDFGDILVVLRDWGPCPR